MKVKLSNPNVRMILLSGLIFLVICFLVFLYVRNKHKEYQNKVQSLENEIENHLSMEAFMVENMDTKIQAYGLSNKDRSDFMLVYRFNGKCCSDCIRSGIGLMEDIFGARKSVPIVLVGDREYQFTFRGKRSLIAKKELLAIDKLSIPYFILLDKHSSVRYIYLQSDYAGNSTKKFLLAVQQLFLKRGIGT